MADVRYLLISNNVVVDSQIGPPGWTDPEGRVAVASDIGGIGWTYNGSTFVAPAPSAVSVSELLAHAMSKQDSVLAQVWSFNVGTAGASVWLTTKLNDRGQASMTQLLVWSTTLAGPNDTEPYNMADGTPGANLTPAQAKSMATQAAAVRTASYAALNQLVAAIQASPATITTKAQIDGFAWPAPASQPAASS